VTEREGPGGRVAGAFGQVGTYRVEGDRLVIRTHGQLFVLRPVARKP
jgi:hypothetical protein